MSDTKVEISRLINSYGLAIIIKNNSQSSLHITVRCCDKTVHTGDVNTGNCVIIPVYKNRNGIGFTRQVEICNSIASRQERTIVKLDDVHIEVVSNNKVIAKYKGV